MPKFGEDSLDTHNAGHFGFTATNLDNLEAAGYTLATIVADRSGSTSGFQQPMEDALKASVEALRSSKTIDPETIMLRVVTIDSDCEEQHGFIPLANIDLDRYDGMLNPRGMTALYDGCINSAEAASEYGKQLIHDRFRANGIMIVITDGANNAGRFSSDSDVGEVAKAIKATQMKEHLESFTTILVAVNIETSEYKRILQKFHADAGFTVPMIALKDADPKTIAKIGRFIVDSVSSTSQSLGTGGPSQSIKF